MSRHSFIDQAAADFAEIMNITKINELAKSLSEGGESRRFR
jgi:hypothetical protein